MHISSVIFWFAGTLNKPIFNRSIPSVQIFPVTLNLNVTVIKIKRMAEEWKFHILRTRKDEDLQSQYCHII